MKTKNVLSLNHEEALDFFMKSERFHGFELPEYFVFDDLLKYVKDTIGDIPYEDCLNSKISPYELEDVNLDILLNKDGRYAVRPIILANPFIYYFLVRELCNEKGWAVIQDCFTKFAVPHISCCSIPIIPKKKEKFHKATTILNWWNGMEQRAVELSLEYRYMFVTDITNCYGSVLPRSFDLAFGLKNTPYETKENDTMSHNVQFFLRALQQGRNLGIPQGSTIFDFVAELLLGYSDLLLHQEIQNAGIEEPYEVIRFRDDYRILCNDKDKLEEISFILQKVLERLNFRMNSLKTKISDSITTDAIKPDKLFYIYNTPIFNKKGVDFDSFEKHLLYILMFGRQFPNSGQMKIMLSDFDDRVKEYLEEENNQESTSSSEEKQKENIFVVLTEKEKNKKKRRRQLVGGSIRAMSAVAAQIAIENVPISHYALRVFSRMVDSLKDEKEKWDIINLVHWKLVKLHNTSYNQLWLQNITYQQDKKNGTSPYDMRLCRLAAGDKSVQLWNNSWLKSCFTENIPYSSIINQDVLRDITPVITFREIRAYNEAVFDEDDFETIE